MSRILVIGGGVMGLGAAWRLAQAGAQVTLLEKGARGGDGASRAAAGMIGPQSEALEDDAYFAATLAARDRWPAFAQELPGIGFHAQGALHLAFGASYEKRLEAKYLWQKRRAGRVERLEGEALFSRFPMLPPRVSAGYFAEGDYWVDNEALCDVLQAKCAEAGVELRFNAEVVAMEPGWTLRLQGGESVSGDQVLQATGAWAQGLCHPVKGQMISFKVPPQLLPEVPLHAEQVYLVPRGSDRLLVGATVEHVGFDTQVTGEGLEWLLQGAFESIPDLRRCAVERLWAGLRPGSSDGWPTVGEGAQPGLHLLLGAYRRGILFLPLLIEAAASSVLGRPLPPEALAFRPRILAA
jgi:glycine oxidase